MNPKEMVKSEAEETLQNMRKKIRELNNMGELDSDDLDDLKDCWETVKHIDNIYGDSKNDVKPKV